MVKRRKEGRSCNLRIVLRSTSQQSPTMRMRKAANDGMAAIPLRTWLCVLLAALILYNPFMAAPTASLGLHAQRTASNRATVGASELQHVASKAPRVFAAQAEVSEERFFSTDVVVSDAFSAPAFAPRVPQLIVPASLCFRPP